MAQHSRNLGQQPDDYSDAGPITTAGELKIVGAWVLYHAKICCSVTQPSGLAVTRHRSNPHSFKTIKKIKPPLFLIDPRGM